MSNIRQMPRTRRERARTKSGARKKRRIQYFDYSLLAVIIFLVCFGLVMLYSTSSYSALRTFEDGMHFFKRQAFFCVTGFVGAYVVSRIDYHIFAFYAKKLYWLSIEQGAGYSFLLTSSFSLQRWRRLQLFYLFRCYYVSLARRRILSRELYIY